MALTDIELSTRALIKLGARPIMSFADGSAESEIASLLFAPTRDGLLSSYAWSFATLQAALTPLPSPPIADFQYSYDIPNDALRILSIGQNGAGQGIPYRIIGDVLCTNADQIILTYIARVSTAVCPPYFDVALMARLAAEFCLPITENTSRADLLARIADQEFARARQIDAQQDTPNALQDFTLINSRF